MLFAPTGGQILTDPAEFVGEGKTPHGCRHKPGVSTFQPERSGPRLGCGAPLDVSTWRRCRLIEAGFPDDLATTLGTTPSVDLHALFQLVDRGCPAELAARILSPLSVGAES